MPLNLHERWSRAGDKVARWTPFAKVNSLLDSMSPRDRRLLLFMVTTIVVVVTLVAVLQAKKHLRYLEQEIARKQQQLELVRAETERYQALKQQIAAIEKQLSENPDFNLTAFLEREADKLGMSDAISINTRGETAKEGFLETLVNVKLRKRSLVDIVRYLYAIETAPQHLVIKSLRIRTSYGSRSDLHVDLDVSIMTPQET